MGYRRLPPLVLPDDPAVLGYLAGIVDGEGHIGITCSFDPKGSVNKSHAPRLVIINTDLRLMSWLVELFDGAISATENKRNPQYKTRYSWQIHGNRCEALLQALRPYLRLKGEQADVVLRFRDLGKHRGGGNGLGPVPLSEELVTEREKLKQQIHVLNARGKKGVA